MHHDIQLFAEYAVTPFVGVWIETIDEALDKEVFQSHPSWVCGLKPMSVCLETKVEKSHPSWVCGLKRP